MPKESKPSLFNLLFKQRFAPLILVKLLESKEGKTATSVAKEEGTQYFSIVSPLRALKAKKLITVSRQEGRKKYLTLSKDGYNLALKLKEVFLEVKKLDGNKGLSDNY